MKTQNNCYFNLKHTDLIPINQHCGLFGWLQLGMKIGQAGLRPSLRQVKPDFFLK